MTKKYIILTSAITPMLLKDLKEIVKKYRKEHPEDLPVMTVSRFVRDLIRKAVNDNQQVL